MEYAEEAGVEADPEEHLLIRRELTSQGKSTSRINGQLLNLSMLREVGEKLINIHGQHEHQKLAAFRAAYEPAGHVRR